MPYRTLDDLLRYPWERWRLSSQETLERQAQQLQVHPAVLLACHALRSDWVGENGRLHGRTPQDICSAPTAMERVHVRRALEEYLDRARNGEPGAFPWTRSDAYPWGARPLQVWDCGFALLRLNPPLPPSMAGLFTQASDSFYLGVYPGNTHEEALNAFAHEHGIALESLQWAFEAGELCAVRWRSASQSGGESDKQAEAGCVRCAGCRR